MMNKHTLTKLCAALLAGTMLVGFVGCAAKQTEEIIDIEELVGTEFDMVPLGDAPQPVSIAMPVASGNAVQQNTKALIDESNKADGYIMVKYLESTSFSGSIKDVVLKDEYAPFRLPNQYVNYNANSAIVAEAKKQCEGCTTDLQRIEKIYKFVVDGFTYDNELAATVTSGYLPNVDAVLAAKKGICFDYAAVMTAMLRSQGIPCKLVIGYAGDVYHAWINAYSASEGWINGVIFFDGNNWKLLDPTFMSTGGESKEILDYVGNSSNYTVMYLY